MPRWAAPILLDQDSPRDGRSVPGTPSAVLIDADGRRLEVVARR